MSDFKREDRYIVIKRSDMEKLPADTRRNFQGRCRSFYEQMLIAGAPARSFLVIESDWPEYEPAWQMIERRMTGQPEVTAAEELEAVLYWRKKHADGLKKRDALQQRTTVADERADVLEGALRTSLLAMKRIYQAGYDRIVDEGGSCDTPEYMMANDPTAREVRALLEAKPETVAGHHLACRAVDDYKPGECSHNCKPDAQPQGVPVAWICHGPEGSGLAALQWSHLPTPPGLVRKIGLCVEQPAPVAVALDERSPQDYAIEHAEYMAKSADDVLAKFQEYGLALLAVDEGGDDGEGELFENIDSTRSDLQEALVDLRGMVYEFRKRAAKSR